MAHYGKFEGVSNYIALVGPKSPSLEETLGYCGQQLVLKAQELGLNTCWVALTYGKSAASVLDGEKEICVISLGYGTVSYTHLKSVIGFPFAAPSSARISFLVLFGWMRAAVLGSIASSFLCR